jgi:4-diphosphocytidyl-2-C-methyl-D-erythritol kinase
MILSSPAKINLSLDILKKRSDGYHDIESNFQFIDWGDKLEIKPSKKLKVQVNNFSISEKENLVTKAVRKLELISDCALNFSINIDKNIPLGSGLGGGSSNAASTLLAINRIAKLNFSLESLLKIGLEIGSDVPFF